MANFAKILAQSVREIKETKVKLDSINRRQEGKESKCKYCKKSVVFFATNIIADKIQWQCHDLYGESHSAVCFGVEDYTPKFTKGDIILSKWKEHTTMYIVANVDHETGYYQLVYEKKRHNQNRIPIKTIDNKSNLCDGEMVEAIFGH